MMKFTVLLLVVAASVSPSVALDCYSCDSSKGDNCIDTKSPIVVGICKELTRVQELDGMTRACFKTIREVNDEGIRHVRRSCGTHTIGINKNCLGFRGSDFENLEYCSSCEDDLCNGSSPVEFTNMWMTLIPAIVTIVIIKFLF